LITQGTLAFHFWNKQILNNTSKECDSVGGDPLIQ
jgi:hypothetical protein